MLPAGALGWVLAERAPPSSPPPPAGTASVASSAWVDGERRIRDLLGEYNRTPADRREEVESRLLRECTAFLDSHLEQAPPDALSLPVRFWLQLAQARGLHADMQERIRTLRARGSLPPDLERALVGYSTRLRTRAGQPAPPWCIEGADPRTGVHWRRFAGELVLLHFWASWCHPCETLVRTRLVALHERYSPAGLVLVNVGVPGNGETAAKQRAFVTKTALPGVTGFDASGRVAAAFGVEAVPYLVLIRGGGTVLAAGPGWKVIEEIERRLGERARSSTLVPPR